MPIPPKMPEVKSIALDELKATQKRLAIIADNSEDPVERLLAIQLAPLLADNINAATGLLLSPGIEQKAKAFCEQLDAEKDGQ